MIQQFANVARSTLAAAIGAADTVLTLAAGSGALFPPAGADDAWWYLALQDGNGIEIARVTARNADTLTVVRGQQGSAARAFAAGSIAGMRLTAADARAWAAAAQRLAGISDDVVFRPSATAITYDADGRVTGFTETIAGASSTTSIAYGTGGAVAQIQTLYRGVLRTEAYGYDGQGRVTGISATEEKQ